MPSMGIDNVCEDECAAFIFGYSAQKLAAYERVQFRVFIDRAVDANEQTVRLELGQVRLKIEAGPAIQIFKIRSALA